MRNEPVAAAIAGRNMLEQRRPERPIDGAADVNTEQVTGQPMLQIKIKQDQIARYGVSAERIRQLEKNAISKLQKTMAA